LKIYFVKYYLIIFLFAGITSAQEINRNEKNDEVSFGIKYPERYQEIELNESINTKVKKIENHQRISLKFFEIRKEKKYSFDIMNSVGSNISFGGIWERYAVINFTPQMFIQPASFISIYANNNLSCLIPLDLIKEHFQFITIQSLAVLAVDNSVKMLFPAGQWIPQLISFAAKNLLINFLVKSSNEKMSNSNTSILQFENFYYSVSINF
jgi:hypothetical protein